MNAKTHFKNITDMLSDASFIYGSHLTVKSWSKVMKYPIFYYSFEHVGSFSLADIFSSGPSRLISIVFELIRGTYEPSNIGICHASCSPSAG